MKERLVRGTSVASVVRVLRAAEHNGKIPELGQWEQDLLRKRVSRSTWYSLAVFESLLQVVHRYVYDGSEAAAQDMGRSFARTMIEEAPEQLLAPGDPPEALGRMHSRWREHFNFGEISVAMLDASEPRKGMRVRLTGYPDMSACHGHSIIGWSMQIAEQSGAKGVQVRIDERPWMHNSVLTYCITWD
jgi:hypothetical protein